MERDERESEACDLRDTSHKSTGIGGSGGGCSNRQTPAPAYPCVSQSRALVSISMIFFVAQQGPRLRWPREEMLALTWWTGQTKENQVRGREVKEKLSTAAAGAAAAGVQSMGSTSEVRRHKR